MAHHAARGGHIHSFEYLLSVGVDTSVVDAHGHGILHHAPSEGSYEMVKKAIPFHSPDLVNIETWSPLHWACRAGSVETVNLLLESGFGEHCITTTNSAGQWTPYSIAVYHQNKSIVPHSGQATRISCAANLKLWDFPEGIESQTVPGGYICDICEHVSTCPYILLGSLTI